MTHPQPTVNRLIETLKNLMPIADLDSLDAAYKEEFKNADKLLAELNKEPLYVADPDKDKYNGWTNHATWCVNLWIDNMTVEDLIDDPSEYTTDHSLTIEIADALKDYVEELNPLAEDANLYSDLLNGGLSDVNYYEIAEHYVSDYRYDHPALGIKRNPATYLVEPDLTFPEWAAYDHKGDQVESGLAYCVEPDSSFWDAFTTCIQHAIDNEYQSIEISWKIQTFDVNNWNESKAKLLIAAQNDRNTKAGN
jgi:hypothetical protein